MHNAAQAYGQVTRQTASPRDLEADLLLKAAAKLQAVCDDESRQGDLHDALTYNRRLWTLLVSSATRPENPLPQAIKNNIANIALFVFNRTMAIQADRAANTVAPLININRQIAAGLRERAAMVAAE
ncbi:flagellar biosynthesis regulator FlaF [Lutibaculum baratangense]|uniref:Flagellar protein FlaF n=1 Tax=Lutibaculum baratangense AMV1 TaxID=631454 RepID=V4RNA2_9HYPH|nr:flagellar biosynthesis regulator FlaF [Lutibaculum baratangense]ESR26764.1 hypothetical protein N177_0548 [Lutibaculum baratangense AMV1]